MLKYRTRFCFRSWQLRRFCQLSTNTDVPDKEFYTIEEYLNEEKERDPEEQRKLEIDNFKELGVTTALRKRLAQDGIVTPTTIQRLALPETLTRNQRLVIQAETGTGKTLTYLIPALQDNRPGLTSLILTPTRELATQVYYWSKKLAGERKDSQRVAVVFSGPGEERQKDKFAEIKPNVLIGTPKIVLKMFRDNKTEFESVRRIVLDEGDKLLQPVPEKSQWRRRKVRELHPRSGRVLVESIMRQKMDLICTSATVNRALKAELSEIGWGPSLKLISTIERATLPPSIEHHVIHCSCEEGDSDKITAIVDHFKKAELTSALVFVKASTPMNKFVASLAERGLKSAALYINLLPELYEQFIAKLKRGEIDVIVGTEQTVRGLDFCFVDTVFLMEVPRNAQEYVHLAGRVGRMGRRGSVVVMVGDNDSRNSTRLERIHSQLGVETRS